MNVSWRLVRLPNTHVSHFVPDADQMEHELTWDCPCGPASSGYWFPDGMAGWGLIHRALDGRTVST